MDLLELEQRLEQLESKTAFQDLTIEELNQVVTQQQMDITRLNERLRLLTERLKATRAQMWHRCQKKCRHRTTDKTQV